MIPHRNLLVVTGDMDADGLIAMAALGSAAFGEPQRISVTSLVRDGNAWRELELDPGHPASRDLRLVRLQMGRAMRRSYDYPPRYAVDGFPSEAQLREMRIEPF